MRSFRRRDSVGLEHFHWWYRASHFKRTTEILSFAQNDGLCVFVPLYSDSENALALEGKFLVREVAITGDDEGIYDSGEKGCVGVGGSDTLEEMGRGG
jgi:hypothetical protein